MIQRLHRFHRRKDIQRLYRVGLTVRSKSCTLRYAPAQSGGYRAAVVVSRKAHKSAVVRNRIRRRVYERIRVQAPYFKTPADMAFIMYDDSFAVLPAQAVATAVDSLLKKAGVV